MKFTVDVLDADGKPVLDETTGKPKTKREAHDLHTFDRRLASLRRAELFKQLQANGSLPKAEVKALVQHRLFKESAEEIFAMKRTSDLANPKARVERWAYPLLGDIPIKDITVPAQITRVLEACRDTGKGKGTVTHLKWDLSMLFKAFAHEGWIPVAQGRVAAAGRVPEDCKVDLRERAVLSDEELSQYLGWRHPNAKYDLQVLERQTLCCVARLFGGARTSELLRLKWSDFEIDDDQFVAGWLTRSKKDAVQKLVIPSMLRPILHLWWDRAGKAVQGLLFPQVKGLDVGKQRNKTSMADALRRDLARAFGLETWDDDKVRYVSDPNAKWTRRQTELLKGTDRYRPVDFHSWRRAFCQAVAASGLDGTAAKKLSSHDTEAARDRYLRSAGTALELPEGALPTIPLTLHDPRLTTTGESADDDDPDPEPPKGSPRPDLHLSDAQTIDLTIQNSTAEIQLWAGNSVGRVLALHAGCHRFKPGPAYQKSHARRRRSCSVRRGLASQVPAHRGARPWASPAGGARRHVRRPERGGRSRRHRGHRGSAARARGHAQGLAGRPCYAFPRAVRQRAEGQGRALLSATVLPAKAEPFTSRTGRSRRSVGPEPAFRGGSAARRRPLPGQLGPPRAFPVAARPAGACRPLPKPLRPDRHRSL